MPNKYKCKLSLLEQLSSVNCLILSPKSTTRDTLSHLFRDTVVQPCLLIQGVMYPCYNQQVIVYNYAQFSCSGKLLTQYSGEFAIYRLNMYNTQLQLNTAISRGFSYKESGCGTCQYSEPSCFFKVLCFTEVVQQ